MFLLSGHSFDEYMPRIRNWLKKRLEKCCCLQNPENQADLTEIVTLETDPVPETEIETLGTVPVPERETEIQATKPSNWWTTPMVVFLIISFITNIVMILLVFILPVICGYDDSKKANHERCVSRVSK